MCLFCVCVHILICQLAQDPSEENGFTTVEFLSENKHIFEESDVWLVESFLEAYTGGRLIFLWDFADIVSKMLQSSPKHKNKSSLSFLQRSELFIRKRDSKIAQIQEEKKRLEDEAVQEDLVKQQKLKQLYMQHAPIYPQRSVDLRPQTRTAEYAQSPSFDSQLRTYPKRDEYFPICGIALTPFVMERLETAEEFVKSHTSNMIALRTMMYAQHAKNIHL